SRSSAAPRPSARPSSWRCRAPTPTPPRLLEAQQRADSAGVRERARAEPDDRAAVRERQADRRVGAVRPLLERRPVERAGAVDPGHAAAVAAEVDGPVGRLVEEQHVDSRIRRRLERLLPPGGGPPAAAAFLLETQERLLLPAGTRLVEERPRGLQQLARPGVGLGPDPADERLARLLRELRLEVAPQLLRRDPDDHEPGAAANAAVELAADRLQVLLDEVLDVALVAGLRPPSLVVLPGLLLGLVGHLLEAPAAQAVDRPPLPGDVHDEGAVASPEVRRERREVQVLPHAHRIAARLAERHGAEEAVRGRGEHGEATCAVAVELVAPPGAEAREVGAEREPAVAGRRPALGGLLGL